MSDDEFISYDDSDSGVSYSPEPDHEDEDDYIGKGPFLYYVRVKGWVVYLNTYYSLQG